MKQEWMAWVGSLRKGSYNRALFRAFTSQLPADVTVEEADIAALPFYNPDLDPPLAARHFWRLVRRADALVFITPEYNASFPAVIKNGIDWASRDPEGSSLQGKPAAILGASMGNFGTLRAQMHLRQVLTFLNADVIHRPEVLLPLAHQKFQPGDILADQLAVGLIRELAHALYQRVSQSVAVS